MTASNDSGQPVNDVAIAHIRATHNNTSITITNSKGDTICWATAGSCGFKGARRGTPLAAQMAAKTAIDEAVRKGVTCLEVRVKGDGPGLSGALLAFDSTDLTVSKQ